MLTNRDERLVNLKPGASYVVTAVLPNVLDKHHSVTSREEEYSIDEVHRMSLVGQPVYLNHLGEYTKVGVCVAYKPGRKTYVLIELLPSSEINNQFAKNALFRGYFKFSSLKHSFETDLATLKTSKRAIEVSFVNDPGRPNAGISYFFPSPRLMQTQDYIGLESFGRIYGFPAPPKKVDAKGKVVNAFCMYDKTLASWTSKTLAPLVEAQKKDVLKNSGYIAANAALFSRKSATMSGTAVAATGTAATSATAATPSAPVGTQATSATPANAMAVDAPSDASTVVTGETLEYAPEDANNPVKMLQKTNARAEKAEKELTQMREQFAKIEAEKTEVERQRLSSLAKTVFDSATGNVDFDADQQKAGMDNMQELIGGMPASTAEQVLGVMKGLVAATKRGAGAHVTRFDASGQEIPQAPQPNMNNSGANAQAWNAHDFQMLSTRIIQKTVAAKHGRQVNPPMASGLPALNASAQYQLPASAARSARDVDDDNDDLSVLTKRKAIAQPSALAPMSGTRVGTVAANSDRATVVSEPLAPAPPEVDPSKKNFVAYAFQASIATQGHNGRLTMPTASDLAMGGFTVKQTGRVQRNAAGQKVAETVVGHKFDEPVEFGVQHFDQAYFDAAVEAVKLGQYRPTDEDMKKMRGTADRANRFISGICDVAPLGGWEKPASTIGGTPLST